MWPFLGRTLKICFRGWTQTPSLSHVLLRVDPLPLFHSSQTLNTRVSSRDRSSTCLLTGNVTFLCSLSALPFHPLRPFIPDIPSTGGCCLNRHEGSMVESAHPLHPPCLGHPSSEHNTKLSAPGCHQGWSGPTGGCRPGTPSHPHLPSRWGICPRLGPQWSGEDVALSNRPEPVWFGFNIWAS